MTTHTTTHLATACECLDRAGAALEEARVHPQDNWRFVYAHTAALRVAAAVLAVRARPRSLRAPRNAWDVLVQVAPELAEWAGYFASSAAKRPLASASSTPVVTAREADDLVRAVRQFIDVAEDCLGLTRAVAQ